MEYDWEDLGVGLLWTWTDPGKNSGMYKFKGICLKDCRATDEDGIERLKNAYSMKWFQIQ